jgi:beta-1,4-mannosyltransferase
VKDRLKVFFLPWFEKNSYQQNLADALGRSGVEVVRCGQSRLFPVLRSLRRHGRPDVVHLHWLSPFVVSRLRAWGVVASGLFLAELLLLQRLGVRIVWTVHNLFEHQKRDTAHERRVYRRVAALCDALVVHCQASRAVVAETYGVADADRRIAVVPHGDYRRNFPDEVDEAAARQRLGIAPASFVYLFFGMVRPNKGIEELIDAFASVDDPTAVLLVVGWSWDPVLTDAIRLAARRDARIRLELRYIEAENVQYYMRAANAVVLPFSEIFTSGSAVLAMGFQRALVVPRIGCLPEYVDSRGGIVYDPRPGALLEALRAIARADCSAMGRHNGERAMRFDWESIALRTARHYRGDPCMETNQPGDVDIAGAGEAASLPFTPSP